MKNSDIFVAAHGQDDNVGDPALRRAMLDGLAPDRRRHVLVGAASHAYVKALGLRPDDLTYTNRRRWQLSAFRHAIQGRAAFVSNAGEIQLNRRRLRINRADRLLVALIRLRGGAAITTGLGIRNPAGEPSATLTSLARACQITTWRDEESQRFARAGAVRPDWAFALGASSDQMATGDRDLLVVSMRGDTPPVSAEWLDAVVSIRTALGLELVTVSQVERDVQRGGQLAESLSGDVHPWHGGDHLAAEADLRSVYRRARVVISDRLHVLIFAATEGAVPLYLPSIDSAKIPRTMAVVGLAEHMVSPNDADLVDTVSALAGGQEVVIERVEEARSILAELTDSMNSLILGGKK
ncbi:hypothetical protein AB1K56_10395 [Microbacterium sp. BWR-S6Y]|uniref:hypothetical protein n=1 Tax=Microbacterium sp. BWR-S6Y TaxID=3232073 RepID=UPI003527FD16